MSFDAYINHKNRKAQLEEVVPVVEKVIEVAEPEEEVVEDEVVEEEEIVEEKPTKKSFSKAFGKKK